MDKDIEALEFTPEFADIALDLKTKLESYSDKVINFCNEQQGNLTFHKTSQHEEFALWQQKVEKCLEKMIKKLNELRDECNKMRDFCNETQKKLEARGKEFENIAKHCRNVSYVGIGFGVLSVLAFGVAVGIHALATPCLGVVAVVGVVGVAVALGGAYLC